MINQIILEGKIKNIDYKDIDGFKCATVNVETARNKKKALFEVEIFGKLAEILKKSDCIEKNIRVVGRLKQSQWTAEGRKKSRISVIAEHVKIGNLIEASDIGADVL